MGKSTDPERKEKKEKKEKKRKHEEDEDIATTPKKEKKDKKRKSTDGAAVAVAGDDVDMVDLAVKDEDEGASKALAVPYKLEALVPFANPLCDDKALKKVLKSVKKGAKNKALKRGVKECVKSIRKSPVAPASALNPSSSSTTLSHGIVVLAADISPLDVISHIPVLCEDHNIPYVYVPSRAELGAAGSTKRPTSVVMLTQRGGAGAAGKAKKTDTEDGDAGEWEEAYRDLHKLAVKMGQTVKV